MAEETDTAAGGNVSTDDDTHRRYEAPDPISNEVLEPRSTDKTGGQVKWFARSFGFLTACEGPERGRDFFVHVSALRPLNNRRCPRLWKGEYVSFRVVDGPNGRQAADVTGAFGDGSPLLCDVRQSANASVRRPEAGAPPSYDHPYCYGKQQPPPPFGPRPDPRRTWM